MAFSVASAPPLVKNTESRSPGASSAMRRAASERTSLAKAGDTVTVHYAGVEFDSGEEFDSSWGRGESIQFPLQGLIQGWQDGIPGMKVGGRRELVIPPHLAYGPAGGHFLGGKTLIFIIDLIAVG